MAKVISQVEVNIKPSPARWKVKDTSNMTTAEIAHTLGGQAFERLNVCALSSIDAPHECWSGGHTHTRRGAGGVGSEAVCCQCATGGNCTIPASTNPTVKWLTPAEIGATVPDEPEPVHVKEAKARAHTVAGACVGIARNGLACQVKPSGHNAAGDPVCRYHK